MCLLNISQYGHSIDMTFLTALNALMWSVKCHVDNNITHFKCHVVNGQLRYLLIKLWINLMVS
jgi:hypothetical protein